MEEHIDGLIFSPVFHIRVGESQLEVDTILTLIKFHRIKQFVEIGIHVGGLTEIILSNTDVKYLGIEIDKNFPDSRVRSMIAERNGRIIHDDCMSDLVLNEVTDFINSGGCTLVYCDNGHKAQEIVRFADSLKAGDFLLTHDYTDGTRAVRDLPYHYFDTREVTEQDIAFLDNDKKWYRLSEEVFKETRNVGWLKLWI